MPPPRIGPLSDVIGASLEEERFYTALLGAFAALALVLAAIGIYGVVSYSVTQRTRELGVRMALGADAGATMRLVLGRSMLLVGAGVVVGLLASIAMTRVIGGGLYQVSPLDPAVLIAVSLLIAASALAASFVPARRATRVDPLVALRFE